MFHSLGGLRRWIDLAGSSDDDLLHWFLLPGLAALAVAMFGWWRDRKRRNRTDPDAVGLVDWTTLSFWASLAACLLLAGALRTWLKG